MAKATNTTPDIRIVIVREGWVFIGRYEYDETLNVVQITTAHCIRIWGTTAGLGQLATQGAQSETVLEFSGVVDVPRESVVATMRCDAKVWPQIVNAK